MKRVQIFLTMLFGVWVSGNAASLDQKKPIIGGNGSAFGPAKKGGSPIQKSGSPVELKVALASQSPLPGVTCAALTPTPRSGTPIDINACLMPENLPNFFYELLRDFGQYEEVVGIITQLLKQDPRLAGLVDKNGRTPLHFAAQHKNWKLAEVLFKEQPFHAKAQYRQIHKSVVEVAFESADKHKNYDFFHALVKKLYCKEPGFLRELVKQAYAENKVQLVIEILSSYLLLLGDEHFRADILDDLNTELRELFVAIAQNHYQMYVSLVLSIMSSFAHYPWICDVVQYFLDIDFGILNTNISYDHDNTPLHVAINRRNINLAALLVKYIQNYDMQRVLDYKNAQGLTPLGLAQQNNASPFIKLLLMVNHGECNYVEKDGRPLHYISNCNPAFFVDQL